MTPLEGKTRTLDIPLGAGRPVLRLVLHEIEHGEVELAIACGYPDRTPWPRLLAEAVCVPGSALPDLARAIEALAPPRAPRAA